MTNTKMTKKMVVNALIDFVKDVDTSEVIGTFDGGNITIGDGMDYLTHELELLTKKSSTRKPSKKVVEANELIKAEIMNVIDSEGMTVTEIFQNGNYVDGTTTQKITAMLRQLKDEGKVVRNQDGKKVSYALNEVGD